MSSPMESMLTEKMLQESPKVEGEGATTRKLMWLERQGVPGEVGRGQSEKGFKYH